jgi:pectate lyase
MEHKNKLKAYMHLNKTILIVVLFLFPLWAAAVNQTYTSVSDGSWKTSSNWFNSSMPSYTGGLNQDNVIIENNILLNDSLSGRNGFTLIIRDGAKLEITGDFHVGNNLNIIVEGTGELIIRGNFYAHNMATVAIEGNVVVNGDMRFWNGGNIFMDGASLYVGGELCGKTGTGLNVQLASGSTQESTIEYGSICADGRTDIIDDIINSPHRTYLF